jgi:benzoyl-CoA reductase/2-hydroxyglutaryl-CoA dehydratase subunit BcrC/BadD/HgdB
MSRNYRLVLREIIRDYYLPFKEKKRKCIWLSAFAPSEIVNCFDVDIVYPESYSAVLAVRKINSELFSIADSLDYDENICSYMRILNGALNFKGRLPFGNVPDPDALIVTNNQCGTLFLMWKLFAEKYNVPLHVLDFPADNSQDGRDQYIVTQMKELVNFMESITGNPMEAAKLQEVIFNSSRTSSLWGEMCEGVFKGDLKLSIHSLVNNYFFPVVCARSDPKTVEFLESALNRIPKDQIENNGDYKKIYWWGYPFWFSNDKFPRLTELGGEVVANNYLKWWYIPINTNESPIDSLVKAYSNTYLNQSLEAKITDFERDSERYNIDGVIVLSNSSCKRDSVISKQVVDELIDRNIPTVEIEGDMCDKSKYQEKQALLRIEAFLESI